MDCSDDYHRNRMTDERKTVSVSVSDGSSHDVQGTGKNFSVDFYLGNE